MPRASAPCLFAHAVGVVLAHRGCASRYRALVCRDRIPLGEALGGPVFIAHDLLLVRRHAFPRCGTVSHRVGKSWRGEQAGECCGEYQAHWILPPKVAMKTCRSGLPLDSE